jgi:hypothetical protein
VCTKACGIRNPREFEMHMCPNSECCRIFPSLDPKDWVAHIHDYCPYCGSSRFKIRAGEPVAEKGYGIISISSAIPATPHFIPVPFDCFEVLPNPNSGLTRAGIYLLEPRQGPFGVLNSGQSWLGHAGSGTCELNG